MTDPRPAPPAERSGSPERTGFWLYAGHLWSVFGIALSNALLAVDMLALGAWYRAGGRAELAARLRRAAPLAAAAVLYLFLLVLSVLASEDRALSRQGLNELFNFATLFLSLAWLRGERQVRRVVDGLVAVGAGVAVWGLSQYLLGFGDLDHRIRGPFSHYMTFAGFLLLTDLLLVAALLTGRGLRRFWSWAALVVINAALLGSLTRSAWVGFALAVVLLLLVRAPRLLFWAAPAAVVFVMVAPVPVLERAASIADLQDRSNYDRLCMAQAGLAMIADHPVLGLGPEMVEERYALYRHPTAPRYQVPHLHNSFLEIAAERGLPSLAAYLWMMVLAVTAAARCYYREGGAAGPRADLLLGTLVALVAFNLAGLFEHNWGDTEVQRPVLFLLAVPFCLGSPRAPGDEQG